jgi:glycosyltransferase involved in cell wall biosynthesis
LASKIIVIDKSSFNKLTAVSKKHIFYLSNPISNQFLTKLNKQRTHSIRESKSLLFVGHVIPTKGLTELIFALGYFREYKLTIAGKIDTSYIKYLNTIINENGLEQSVNFIGEINEEELIKLYLKSSIFIFPTYTEGFPNVILECLLAECPVISSGVGAIPDILENQSDFPLGLCIAPRSIEAIQDALFDFNSNYELYLERAKRGRQIVIEKYNSNITLENLSNIYKQKNK